MSKNKNPLLRVSTIINSRIRGVLGKQELATLLSTDRTKQMSIIQNDF